MTKKFVYYLAEQPKYPNEIWANSKAEVRKLILENIPDESAILDIVEVQADGSTGRSKVDEIIESEPDDYQNGQAFFNNIIAAASVKGRELDAKAAEEKKLNSPEVSEAKVLDVKTTSVQLPHHEYSEREAPASQPQISVDKNPKFFEESGMQFKLECGKLYKKTWTNVTDVEKPDYRIVSKQTNKPISSDKYKIEKLEWVEISSNV